MPVSSVTVCASVSALPAAPVLNSATVAFICTSWPTLTAGAVLVNTKMPSDVAGSPSPVASCMKKPLLFSFVTTPRVTTPCPTSGLLLPLP